MSGVGPDQAPEMGQPAIESARESAVTRLGRSATGDTLTLDEYARRVAALEQAVTAEEIEAALSGLPEDASVVPTASHHRGHPSRDLPHHAASISQQCPTNPHRAERRDVHAKSWCVPGSR
jgi:hypothetical protein